MTGFLIQRWLPGDLKSSYRRKVRCRWHRRKLVVESLESRRLMAVIEVTTLNDLVDPNDGMVSLREAIQSANQSSDSDKISFASYLTSDGPATIKLAGSELKISNSVEIVGPTSNALTIDADFRSRVFLIEDFTNGSTSTQVTISKLRMIGGQSTAGGAILSHETLILIGCTVADSSGTSGGAIYNTGILNVWESLFYNNQASLHGGAIESSGTLSIVDSTIAMNSAGGAGGGIYFDSPSSYFIVINATIAGNTAGSRGGGIGSTDGTVVRMANTIVAGNTQSTDVANDIAGIVQDEASYSMIGVAENTLWTDGVRSSIIGIDWRTVLENDGTRPSLNNNGGHSETIAILPGSRAIDAGSTGVFADSGIRTDQRGLGFPRVERREIDMGAFERTRELVVITLTPSSTRYADGSVLFTAAVSPEDPRVTQMPTGTLNFGGFLSAGNNASIGSQVSTLENGSAIWSLNETSYGIYRVEASYLGDDTFLPSFAPNFIRTGKLIDFGDAPSADQSGFARSYPVILEDNGARHSSNMGNYLGSGPDDELDGKPSENADSDANEDGIRFLTPLIVSNGTTQASVAVTLTTMVGSAKLDGWIDFNRDGDWDDAGEQIFRSRTFVDVRTAVGFTVPAGASPGPTAARFRLSSLGDLKPTGPAYDGEVEDYIVTLASDVGTGVVLDAEASAFISEILTENDETIIKGRLSKDVLFRATRTQASRVKLESTSASTWTVNNLLLDTAGSLEIELGVSSDIIRLLGSSQILTVNARSSLSSSHLYAQIDITGSGDNTLILQTSLPRMRLRYDFGDQLNAVWNGVDQPAVIEGQFVHQVAFRTARANIELHNATPFQNPKNRFDSDWDGTIAATDALATINALRRSGNVTMDIPTSVDPTTWRYTDVNGDNSLSPIDVLMQINELKRLDIPIPNLGSTGLSKGSSGSWTISGNSTYQGAILLNEGIIQAYRPQDGPHLNSIQQLGSITVNPYIAINNPTKLSVVGRNIAINAGPTFVKSAAASNAVAGAGSPSLFASGEGEASNSSSSAPSSSFELSEEILDWLAPVVGK